MKSRFPLSSTLGLSFSRYRLLANRPTEELKLHECSSPREIQGSNSAEANKRRLTTQQNGAIIHHFFI